MSFVLFLGPNLLKPINMIKKILVLSFVVCATLTSIAQNQRQVGIEEVLTASELKINSLNSPSMVVDTLAPATYPNTCLTPNNGFVFYRVDRKAPMDSGFWYGTNVYAITDIAQKYTVTGNVNVQGLLGWAARKGGTNWTSTASIMTVNATTKAPNTSLGNSNPMSGASLTLPALTIVLMQFIRL